MECVTEDVAECVTYDVLVLRGTLAVLWAVASLFRTSYSVLVLVFMYKPTEHVKAVSGLKANSGVRKSVGREAYYAQTGIYV